MANEIDVTVRSRDQATQGLKAVDRAAENMADKVRSASLAVEQADLKVERATKSVTKAQERFGKESLQAREASVRLGRAQLNARTAARNLAAAQDDVADSAGKAGRSMDDSADGARRGSRGFDGLKGSIAKVGAGLAAATAGLAAFGVGLEAALDKWDAQAVLSAQLDALGPAAAERAGAAAAAVYGDAFGENLGEASEAVRRVWQDIGQGSKEWSVQTTEQVMAVARVFDTEFSEVTRAAGQLLRTGLASDATEAMDMVARGFQLGIDKSGDFADTLEEYSTQFRSMGLSGATAMGLLSQGLAAGARDADTVADVIKEFTIEAIRGADNVSEGMKALGLSAEDMSKKFGAGGDASAAALDTVLDRLRAVKDPLERNAIAAQLFGERSKDLGDALYALDPSEAAKALGDFGGAAQDVADKLDTPRAKIEKLKRLLSEKFGEGLARAMDMGAEAAERLRPYAEALAEEALPKLQAMGESLADTWARMQENGLAEDLERLAKVAGAVLGTAFLTSLEAALLLVDGLGKVADGAAWVSTAFKKSADRIDDWWHGLTEAADTAGDVASRIPDTISAGLASLPGRVAAIMSAMRARAVDRAQSMASGVTAAAGRAAAGLTSRITSGVSRAVSTLASLPRRGASAISSLPGRVAAMAAGAGTWLYAAGRRVIAGFVAGVRDSLASARGTLSGYVGSLRSVVGFAHGGTIGAAGGGPRTNWVEVGEHGRELIRVPAGTQVMSNPDTERTLAGAGQAGATTIQLEWTGGAAGDEFLAWLRKNIRVRGGLTAALGS